MPELAGSVLWQVRVRLTAPAAAESPEVGRPGQLVPGGRRQRRGQAVSPLWQDAGAPDLLRERVLAASDADGLAGINATLATAGLPPALPWPPGWRQRRLDGVWDP